MCRQMKLCAWAMIAATPLLSPAAGQQTDGNPTDSPAMRPAAAKQEMIRDRVRRLEDRMFRLQESLADTEPQSAAKLADALRQIGEAGIEEKVEQLITLLSDEASLWQASDRQQALVADLEAVLNTLLQRGDADARRRRIEMLQQHRRDIEQLLEEQQAQRNAAAKASSGARRARQIADAIDRLDRLIEAQQAQQDATQATSEGQAASRQATEQQQLSDQAQQLADDVGKIEDGAAPSTSSDADQTSDAAGESTASEAAGEIQSAGERMEAAAESLRNQDAPSAAEQQTEALEELHRARHRLQEEAERIERQDQADSAEQAAGKQRSTANKTGKLAQRMQGEQQAGGDQQGGQQGGDPSQSEPAPGQHNVEQARKHMDDAAEDLEGRQAGDATDDQDQAIQQLEQARRDLEEELQQLRREERQELLRDLEARFADMLARQVVVNTDTSAITARGADDLARADKLRVAEMADQQQGLADDAATCVHILEEEGTTVVFPRIVGQLSEDMLTVAQRLAELRIGAITQSIQEEIAATLQDLIEAVRLMQDQDDQQQQQQEGSSDENTPLLPGSAELKLLRAAQVRVNTRTVVLEEARLQALEPADQLGKSAEQTARRQGEVADIAREMRDRVAQSQ